MFIIWGTRGRTSKEGMLRYNCMVCPSSSLEVHSQRKWFTFFFIPVFPISEKKHYVVCKECENSYTFRHLETLLQQVDFVRE